MSQFANIKQGMFRLWLIFTIPWFAWFSWQTYDSYSDKITYQDLIIKTYKNMNEISKNIDEISKELIEEKKYQLERYESQNKFYYEIIDARDKATDRLDLNIRLLPIPFILLIFYPLTLWVIRGFKGT